MKVYLITDHVEMTHRLVTENELRAFVEEELKDGDRITEDDLWAVIEIDKKEAKELKKMVPNWWDLSFIDAHDLMEIINTSDGDYSAEKFELPEYSYETIFGQNITYEVKRLVPDALETLHSRQEADNYLEAIRGLTDKK